uniref:Uncharacterized protein n=1 Tax=Roseihalotalea indica TaxID=2867963 RepID=A0AA49GTC2_9BACT|nr:hypothetical protein K4G66_05995 [Tunicatimonas sp. TK19036]
MYHQSIEYLDHQPPSHYTLDFEPHLYNQESFLQLKNYSIQSFYATDRNRQTVIARIHFAILSSGDNTRKAVSLPELPFGSLEYSTDFTLDQLQSFISYVKEQLAFRKVTTIEIRDCIPEYRGDYGISLQQGLLHQGFSILEKQDNHHIPVDAVPLRDKVHTMEVRRLKKCESAEFTFRQEPLTNTSSIYQFILECRAAKSQSLSLSLEELLHMTYRFPQAYQLFAVYDQARLIAASLAILVNERSIYNFYPASHLDYQPFSPMVFLLKNLYNLSWQRGVQLIDLGTSISPSLAAFKTHVGGMLSHKKTYYLEV